MAGSDELPHAELRELGEEVRAKLLAEVVADAQRVFGKLAEDFEKVMPALHADLERQSSEEGREIVLNGMVHLARLTDALEGISRGTVVTDPRGDDPTDIPEN